jgi:nickel-type superoxide dismutase maturation protease
MSRRGRAALGVLTTFTLLAMVPEIQLRAARLHRSWDARVAIEGPSMEPTVSAGDWLLVDPDAFAETGPTAGDLVLVPDPRQPQRLLIKRVDRVDPDGWLRLAGEAPDTSTDSRTFGALEPGAVLGRPWFRYWPLGRLGRVA